MTAHTVLVVEDNPVTRKLVRVTLADAGYTVLEAADGKSAVELFRTATPDLVLQDLLLPDVGGFDLIAQLRGLPGGADVPVIAFSGFLSRIEIAQAATLGFTDFLVKPVEPSRLLQTVQTYLPAPTPLAEKPGRGRRILVADDDPIQLKLAQLHLGHEGFQVITAGDGEEALEQALRVRPDAILSDVLMPRFDGFQLCLAVRQDARLGHIPVVLLSGNYLDEPDRRLARKVGANALIARTPDLRDAIAALLASLEAGAPAVPTAPLEVLEVEHFHRVIRQLERQVATNVGLLQRASLQAAVLSMLAGLSGALARPLDLELAPSELLASLLDGAGISMGALYLVEPGGRLALAAQTGYASQPGAEPETFFGHQELFERALRAGTPMLLPSAAQAGAAAPGLLGRLKVACAVIAPLVSRGERLGVMLLASNRRDLADRDWLAFAETMALQVAQTLALGRAFTDLAASERRYRGLFDQVPVGLLRSTSEGQILDANPALVELLGFRDRESLLAVSATSLYAEPEDRRGWQAEAERAGIVRGLELRMRRRDGGLIWVRVSARVVRDGDGRVLYDASLEDVTARRDAEAQLERNRETLAQTEKLAAMGQLLAGVAHELNNPLFVVMGQTALLRQTRDPAIAARAEKASHAAERCGRIVKNFLALARQHPPERHEVRLNAVVTEAVELLAYPLRVDDVEVALDLPPDVPTLWADPHQLHQVLVNLIANAHHAMREAPRPRRLTIATGADPGRARVHLEVRDTGPGIPPEVRARIFEPFFTTKPAGEGTGLGLSLCRGIVEEHGGTIGVESVFGHGAVFRVELPVVAPPRAALPAALRVEATPVAGKAILLVDDEPQVAEMLSEMLTIEGHRVDTAANGRVALKLLETRAYDVILSDLRMPELDGPGLYREVERRHPALARRFVFLTGDTLSPDVREFLARGGAPSLGKPFAPEEVRRVIRLVLTGGGS